MCRDHFWLKSLDSIWLGSRESMKSFEEGHAKERCGADGSGSMYERVGIRDWRHRNPPKVKVEP